MPLTMADMGVEVNSEVPPLGMEDKVKGVLVGSIGVRVWSNARPEYSFSGKITGKHLQLVGHNLRKAYIQTQALKSKQKVDKEE